MTLGMSSDGRYVTGLNTATYCGFVWDTRTNSIVECPNEYANCDFRSVTNTGCAYGILGSDDMVTTYAAWFDNTGEVSYLDDAMSQCFDVTPDGKIAVGCLLDDIMWWPTACYWENGKRTELPVPTAEECGFEHDGANAVFVSNDGSVIAGYLLDAISSRPAIVWHRQEDGTYQYDVVCKDYWEVKENMGKPYVEFQCLALSGNGEWIALAVRPESVAGVPQTETVARFNLKSHVLEVSELPVADADEGDSSYPSGIANNGTLVGTAVASDSRRRGLVWYSDAPCATTLLEAFPTIEVFDEYDFFMHSAVSISDDAHYIGGYACPVDGMDYNFESYVLNVDGIDAIEELNVNTTNSSRYFINGMLLFENKGTKYDLQGRVSKN